MYRKDATIYQLSISLCQLKKGCIFNGDIANCHDHHHKYAHLHVAQATHMGTSDLNIQVVDFIPLPPNSEWALKN